jgi:hypothetical protein
MRLVAVVAVALGLGAAPAQAAPETSPGVRLVSSIPERGVISARAVGSHLYVSSLTGVTIFDISRPQAPVRVGRLDLPNAQNEDVDVGSGILLVSDDPFGGRGILHVIDVHDPAHPRLLSTYSTWARGMFELPAPRRRGIGHTATCIQRCRYAWLAGSSAGIEVVDLRDPAHPRRAGRFSAAPAAGFLGTHDVQVDASGLAWVAGGNGTAAYDPSRNPVHPRLVRRTDRRGSRGPLNDFIHHNSMRLSRRVVAITEEDFGDQCKRAGSLQTWRIAGRRLHPLDSFGVERDGGARVACSAHYFDASHGLIAQGFYEQGVRLIDARRPRRLRQVGYYISRPGLFWGALFAPSDATGSTVYALDHSRGIDVLALDRAALKPVRRRGASRPIARPKLGFSLFVGARPEAVRRGQRLQLALVVGGRGGPVRVQAEVPPQLTVLKVPAGVAYDAATRTLSYTVARVRDTAIRRVQVRVARSARRGGAIEVIGYASGPDDPMPLDDRGVYRAVVVRRAGRSHASAARVQPWQGFCRLPYDYTK